MSRWIEREPHPIERAGTSAILLVSLMMAIEAGLMLGWPSALGATPLLALRIAATTLGMACDLRALAALALAAAALATAGALLRMGWVRLMILLPQNCVLGIMAFGGIAAATEGQYLDGTVIPWPHIAADQLAIAVLFAVHSVAIVKRARDPNG